MYMLFTIHTIQNINTVISMFTIFMFVSDVLYLALLNMWQTHTLSLSSLPPSSPPPPPPPLPPHTHTQFLEQVIFLQPVPGHYIPHLLYCLEVYPGIVLVMVAEYGVTPQLAGNICQTIMHMNEVLTGLRSSSSSSSHGQQSTYDILDEGVK